MSCAAALSPSNIDSPLPSIGWLRDVRPQPQPASCVASIEQSSITMTSAQAGNRTMRNARRRRFGVSRSRPESLLTGDGNACGRAGGALAAAVLRAKSSPQSGEQAKYSPAIAAARRLHRDVIVGDFAGGTRAAVVRRCQEFRPAEYLRRNPEL